MKVQNRNILLYIILCAFIAPLSAQQSNNQQEEIIVLQDISSNSKREEVQRYFGYDKVLTNYITLPYDVSSNVNEKGKFVDIGYYLFGLLPLILLFFLRKKKVLFYTMVVLLTTYLLFCLSHSILYDENLAEHSSSSPGWDTFVNLPDKRFDIALLTHLFDWSEYLISPINLMVYKISGETDGITYPILACLFGLILFLIYRSKSLSHKMKILSTILFVYSYLWLLLSGGIIWYAFLVIPLGLLIIGLIYSKSNQYQNSMLTVLKIMIPLVMIGWGILIFALRISNITVSRQLNKEHVGKTILEANLLYYSTGILDADQTLDHSFKNLSIALKKINKDDNLIYMVGTSFGFDITKSTSRVYTDNLLNNFFLLLKNYPDKVELIKVLKASNFKYIIVDLFTDTLDQTPEKSLTQKYKLFLNTLYKNPNVSLIATNRIIEFTDVNGKKQQIGNVFGNIVYRGSYAVYEIL